MPRKTSPQRSHTGSVWTGTSAQQASQIGADERSGRGEPQRAQTEGSKTQPTASMGLRSTRATARQAEVPDGGTLSISALGSLLKTHLSQGRWRPASSVPLSLLLSSLVCRFRANPLHEKLVELSFGDQRATTYANPRRRPEIPGLGEGTSKAPAGWGSAMGRRSTGTLANGDVEPGIGNVTHPAGQQF